MFVLLLSYTFTNARQNLLDFDNPYQSVSIIEPSISYDNDYCAIADIANQMCEQALWFENTEMIWSSPAVFLFKDVPLPTPIRCIPGVIHTNSNSLTDDIEWMMATPASMSKVCKSAHYISNLHRFRAWGPDNIGRWQNLIWYAQRIGLRVTYQ